MGARLLTYGGILLTFGGVIINYIFIIRTTTTTMGKMMMTRTGTDG